MRRTPKAKRKRTVGKNMRVVLALDEYLPDNLSINSVDKIRYVKAPRHPAMKPKTRHSLKHERERERKKERASRRAWGAWGSSVAE